MKKNLLFLLTLVFLASGQDIGASQQQNKPHNRTGKKRKRNHNDSSNKEKNLQPPHKKQKTETIKLNFEENDTSMWDTIQNHADDLQKKDLVVELSIQNYSHNVRLISLQDIKNISNFKNLRKLTLALQREPHKEGRNITWSRSLPAKNYSPLSKLKNLQEVALLRPVPCLGFFRKSENLCTRLLITGMGRVNYKDTIKKILQTQKSLKKFKIIDQDHLVTNELDTLPDTIKILSIVDCYKISEQNLIDKIKTLRIAGKLPELINVLFASNNHEQPRSINPDINKAIRHYRDEALVLLDESLFLPEGANLNNKLQQLEVNNHQEEEAWDQTVLNEWARKRDDQNIDRMNDEEEESDEDEDDDEDEGKKKTKKRKRKPKRLIQKKQKFKQQRSQQPRLIPIPPQLLAATNPQHIIPPPPPHLLPPPPPQRKRQAQSHPPATNRQRRTGLENMSREYQHIISLQNSYHQRNVNGVRQLMQQNLQQQNTIQNLQQQIHQKEDQIYELGQQNQDNQRLIKNLRGQNKQSLDMIKQLKKEKKKQVSHTNRTSTQIQLPPRPPAATNTQDIIAPPPPQRQRQAQAQAPPPPPPAPPQQQRQGQAPLPLKKRHR